MGKTSDIASLENTLVAAEQIIGRAFRITEGPPFNMAAEEEFAGIEIDGDKATLFWPEYEDGYYAGDGSMQRQSVSFPSRLLLMSLEEIATWKAAEQAKHDAKQKAVREVEERKRAEQQTAHEKAVYEMLKAKFGA